MNMMNSPILRSHSPWGYVDNARLVADGIVFVSTPSHGGYWVSPEREAMIPDAARTVARQYAPAQWYEEDCDWCIVAVSFPEAFDARSIGHAVLTALSDRRRYIALLDYLDAAIVEAARS